MPVKISLPLKLEEHHNLMKVDLEPNVCVPMIIQAVIDLKCEDWGYEDVDDFYKKAILEKYEQHLMKEDKNGRV